MSVVTMKRAPTVSDAERKRRLSQVYRYILSLAAKSNDDAPGAVSEAGPGASSDDRESRRRAHDITSVVVAQVGGAP